MALHYWSDFFFHIIFILFGNNPEHRYTFTLGIYKICLLICLPFITSIYLFGQQALKIRLMSNALSLMVILLLIILKTSLTSLFNFCFELAKSYRYEFVDNCACIYLLSHKVRILLVIPLINSLLVKNNR